MTLRIAHLILEHFRCGHKFAGGSMHVQFHATKFGETIQVICRRKP